MWPFGAIISVKIVNKLISIFNASVLSLMINLLMITLSKWFQGLTWPIFHTVFFPVTHDGLSERGDKQARTNALKN